MPVAPPNHSGNSPAEEGRIHKGLYENYHRHKKSLESLVDRSVKFPSGQLAHREADNSQHKQGVGEVGCPVSLSQNSGGKNIR